VTTDNEDIMLTENNPTLTGQGLSRSHQSQRSESMSGRLSEVQERPRRAGNLHRVKEFMCIGESHRRTPHVYINMGEADTILCPYCATRSLQSWIDTARCPPPDSFFADNNAV